MARIVINKAVMSEVIAGVLVLLFVYTAASKLVDREAFEYQISKQPLPEWFNDLLVWALPIAELTTSLVLLPRATRKIGMLISFVLMMCFTVYVGLAVLNVFGEVPCSCGGVLQSLSWEAHLVFNVVFLGIATVGWWIVRSDQ